MAHRGRKWKYKDMETLKEQLAMGTPYEEIAKMIGRPLSGIAYKAREISPIRRSSYRPWASDEDIALAEMVAHGMTQEEVAEALNRTWASVQSRCIDKGIKSPHAEAVAQGMKSAKEAL